MQLAATGCRRNILQFHRLFEGKMLLVHYGDNHIQKFSFGEVYHLDIRSKIMVYCSANISPLNYISNNISDPIPLQMKILNIVIP